MNLSEYIAGYKDSMSAEERQARLDEWRKIQAKGELEVTKQRAKIGITNFEVSRTEITCPINKLCFTYKGRQIEVTPFVEFDEGWLSGFDLTLDDIYIDIHELNDGDFGDYWCAFGCDPTNVRDPEFQELVFEIVNAYLEQNPITE